MGQQAWGHTGPHLQKGISTWDLTFCDRRLEIRDTLTFKFVVCE